jgi:hypothetical protein
MKPDRNATDLAARLTQAAQTPPPLPPPTRQVQSAEDTSRAPPAKVAKATQKGRPSVQTRGITLRPSVDLLTRYTLAAAERTRKVGRVVSAQEVMLERLDGGP